MTSFMPLSVARTTFWISAGLFLIVSSEAMIACAMLLNSLSDGLTSMFFFAAADHRVAGADLLGDVDAALADLEGDVQPLGLEVAALLGDHERAERRQGERRRQEIGDVLGRRLADTARHSRCQAEPGQCK